jgi:hypothetical protein
MAALNGGGPICRSVASRSSRSVGRGNIARPAAARPPIARGSPVRSAAPEPRRPLGPQELTERDLYDVSGHGEVDGAPAAADREANDCRGFAYPLFPAGKGCRSGMEAPRRRLRRGRAAAVDPDKRALLDQAADVLARHGQARLIERGLTIASPGHAPERRLRKGEDLVIGHAASGNSTAWLRPIGGFGDIKAGERDLAAASPFVQVSTCPHCWLFSPPQWLGDQERRRRRGGAPSVAPMRAERPVQLAGAVELREVSTACAPVSSAIARAAPQRIWQIAVLVRTRWKRRHIISY